MLHLEGHRKINKKRRENIRYQIHDVSRVPAELINIQGPSHPSVHVACQPKRSIFSEMDSIPPLESFSSDIIIKNNSHARFPKFPVQTRVYPDCCQTVTDGYESWYGFEGVF